MVGSLAYMTLLCSALLKIYSGGRRIKAMPNYVVERLIIHMIRRSVCCEFSSGKTTEVENFARFFKHFNNYTEVVN